MVLLTFLNSKGGRKQLTLIHHSHLKAATGLELEPGNPAATKGTSTTAESDSPAARNPYRVSGSAVDSLILGNISTTGKCKGM